MQKRTNIPGTEPGGADTNSESKQQWDEDLEFVALLLVGDEQATQQFALRVAKLPAFLRQRNRRLGMPLSDDELLDLVQDVLGTAWRKLDSYQGNSEFFTWVCGIGSFKFMDAIRGKRRRERKVKSLTSSDGESLVEKCLNSDDLDQLSHALSGLAPDEWELLRLKHHDGLSFLDLAERLKITPSGVKNRYYRLLDAIRQRLLESKGGSSS